MEPIGSPRVPCETEAGLEVPKSTGGAICMEDTVVSFCCTPAWVSCGAGSHAACPCSAPGVERESPPWGASGVWWGAMPRHRS